MGVQNLFITLLMISIVHAQNPCPASSCGKNAPTIQYPFWLQNQSSSTCRNLPGFNLTCNSQKIPVLYIPHSGEFHVKSIYYYIKIVSLYDPENCLPRRLLSLNLSSSPFNAVDSRNYTFFSCPKGSVSFGRVLNCLSNTTDFVATKNGEDFLGLSKCKKNVTLSIPGSLYYYDYGLFPDSIDLTWGDIPEIGSLNKQHASRTIALIFVIPALSIPLLIVGVSCCICMTRSENSQTSDSIQTSGGVVLSDRSAAGLDKSTIDTYRRITVGASRRIEGPNGVTCTICLADYVPEDTIRFMPECEHCFHVDCIDKWLGINSKCPICRNSQMRIESP